MSVHLVTDRDRSECKGLSRVIPSTTALRDSAVEKKTKKAYNEAVDSFLDWTLEVESDAVSVSDLDRLLERYMESLYQDGVAGGKDKANRSLWGILQLEPGWKTSFPLSRQALMGWKSAAPSKSYPPATWQVCAAIAATMAKNAHFECGVACLLSFDCYLRIGEMLNLMVDDVSLPQDRRLGEVTGTSGVRLSSTKTGKNQWVTIGDARVAHLLSVVVKGKSNGDRLWSFKRHEYSAIFKASCIALGIGQVGYVHHSMRHGGATRDYMVSGMSIETIMFRGRWKSNESARVYIQAGRARLLDITLPDKVHLLGVSILKKLDFRMLKYNVGT
jgi:integrase